MERITVTRPVAVLVRVTAGYRQALIREVQAALQGLEREEAGSGADEDTRAKRVAETRAKLLARSREIAGLADGRLVLHGRLESLVDIRVGDRWRDGVEVILEDGRVVEIREANGGGGVWNT